MPLRPEAILSTRCMRVLAAALATSVCYVASPAVASAACGSSGYAYAGVGSTSRAYGISTRLQATTAPQVLNGHVAGWVGVGGPGAGPNGTDEWLQVGFSAFPGSAFSSLYYEVAQPHQAPRYFEVKSGLPPGTMSKVAVVDQAPFSYWAPLDREYRLITDEPRIDVMYPQFAQSVILAGEPETVGGAAHHGRRGN